MIQHSHEGCNICSNNNNNSWCLPGPPRENPFLRTGSDVFKFSGSNSAAAVEKQYLSLVSKPQQSIPKTVRTYTIDFLNETDI